MYISKSKSKGATSWLKIGRYLGCLSYIPADMYDTKQDCAQEKTLEFSIVKIYKFLPEVS